MSEKPRKQRGGPQRKGRNSFGAGPKREGQPRSNTGINIRMLERLEQEGLLSDEGRRLRDRLQNSNQPLARTKAPVQLKPRQRIPLARGGRSRLEPAEALVAQRLQKVMAQAGVASRRHSEELIQAGRVTVNGRVVTELGTKVVPGKDLIEVDGQSLGRPQQKIYILLNKPKGYVTTLYDPQDRPKVVDLLGDKVTERVYPVGRLDYDTEGLLLLTNDGELANALMHPARQIKKTYIAKVRGVPGPGKLKKLEEGIELEDGLTAPAEAKLIEVKAPNSATISIRIHEGRNRQVRRMFEAIGHEVIHLRRSTLGPLHIKNLAAGQWRELSPAEVESLRQIAQLSPRRRIESPVIRKNQAPE